MIKNSRILLVEDEETLAVGLEFNLTAEGYQVTWVTDGKQALEKYNTTDFDLIILDIMLPYLSGFDVAGAIRKEEPQLPILMLTARTGLADRIHGLEIGADDYMTKPFHLEELLLRVEGMLKRKQWYRKSADVMPIFRFGDNEINFENLLIKTGEKEIQLTAHEAMLLRYLIDNKGKVVSRKELLNQVWNITSEIETRTVDNFIVRLRKYFEPNPEKPIYIKSVRGIGYLFDENPLNKQEND